MQLTTICSTRYNASTTGQTLEVLCDEQHKDLAYKASSPELPEFTIVQDWLDAAYELLEAMSLNAGDIASHQSVSHILTSLQLQKPRLNETLPSPAEALVSLALCKALDLAQGVPFAGSWVGNPVGITAMSC
jgi:hypothetical protein